MRDYSDFQNSVQKPDPAFKGNIFMATAIARISCTHDDGSRHDRILPFYV